MMFVFFGSEITRPPDVCTIHPQGPSGQINDYAAKHWQGLMGDYYGDRWDLWISYLNQVGRSVAGLATVQSAMEIHF